MKQLIHRKITHYKGRKFHSKLEAIVAFGLDRLREQGKIHAWTPQFSFHLRGDRGEFLGIKYVADFLVWRKEKNQEGKEFLATEIWEPKGRRLRVYINKMAVMKPMGFTIKEITYKDREVKEWQKLWDALPKPI